MTLHIQFLYDDVIHATPLLRAQEALRGKNIAVTATKTHGVEAAMRLIDREADVLLIHQTLVSDDILSHGVPVIILERIDGAQLAAARPWLTMTDRDGAVCPSVAAVWKGYIFRDRTDYNRYRGRLHAHLLKEAGVYAVSPDKSMATPGSPKPQLSSVELAKIQAGYGFGAYSLVDAARSRSVDFTAHRDIDVTFYGWTDYSGSEIETHRKAAIKHVMAWGDKHPGKATAGEGRPLDGDAYHQNMLSAKCVVSPFGWGESAHRDYEAMLLGAVLIKPSMDRIDCYPRVYVPYETYIPCRLDFADVPDIVARVVGSWPEWQHRRERARRIAEQAGTPERTAHRIATLLEPYT